MVNKSCTDSITINQEIFDGNKSSESTKNLTHKNK